MRSAMTKLISSNVPSLLLVPRSQSEPAETANTRTLYRQMTQTAKPRGRRTRGFLWRSFFRLCSTATTALRRNILRSMLTTLGIVIGIMSVIAIMEIGKGASTTLGNSIQSMGSNMIIVMPGAASAAGIEMGAGTLPTLTPDDVTAILAECPSVAAAAPTVSARMQVLVGANNWVPATMLGTTPEYLTIRDWNLMDQGECFTHQDVRNANKVCIVGQTIVKELFDGQPPIGRSIRINNVPIRVIGVLSKKGANVMGMDQDDILLTPWTTMKNRISASTLGSVNQSAVSGSTDGVNSFRTPYPRSRIEFYTTLTPTQILNTPRPQRQTNVDQIFASAVSMDKIQLAVDEIQESLARSHGIRPGQAEDFNLRNMTELTKMFGSTTVLMTNLLLAIAMIALLVGGVGIMNIMLVSVTERTREIGLRMAVGAKGRDILAQFLVEAVFLCLFGAAVGIALGRGISILVSTLAGWPIAASPQAILTAVGVSLLIGVGFGFYPAWRASKLDPIDALRYE
jgi:ABC-type antimicrobial peptide transport system permease subunit